MNYYNDNDPFCCGWIKELIYEGLIPKGDIDSRDIRDIPPGDLRGYVGVHFFAGIGGWAYALRLAGWPDNKPIWSGSCPCQPFSVAGKGAGLEDERHLWPAFRWLIAQCRPEVIVGEQVASIDGVNWLTGVYDDLEAIGYAVPKDGNGLHELYDIPAAAIGAPHIRQRLFWLGIAKRARLEKRICLTGNAGKNMAHQARERFEQTGNACGLDNTPSPRRHPAGQGAEGKARHGSRVRGFEPGRPTGGLADAEPQHDRNGESGAGRWPEPANIGSDGGLADTDSGRQHQRNEGKRGLSKPNTDGPWRNSILIPCADGKPRRVPVEPALYPLADGIPNRVGMLRGAGNAIVPQIAAEFIRAFMEENQ